MTPHYAKHGFNVSPRTYRLESWYSMGATQPPYPPAYYASHNDGPECRHAYLAGVMARAFGVDLSEVVL